MANRRGLEYTDCIPCRVLGLRPQEKRCTKYDTKLHLMLRIRVVEIRREWNNSFIAITHRSSLIWRYLLLLVFYLYVKQNRFKIICIQ